MIRHKGHSISAEFAGIDKPDRFVVRRLSACGNVGMSLLGSFASLDDAKAAIDAAQPLTADTITDEQIRELAKGPSRERHEIDGMLVDRQYIRGLCQIALCEGARRDHKGALLDDRSRARCAEILNGHAEGKS